jgi:hypothetical protein
MALEKAYIPYPDFKLYDTIDPEEFDANNEELQNKLNATVDEVNRLADEKADIEVAIGELQDEKLNKTEVTAQPTANKVLRLDADGKLPTSVTGDADATVDKLNAHKISGDHDNRYYKKNEVYSRQELMPYLEGGNTEIVYEVFTIVSSNNGDGTFTYKNKDGEEIIGDLGENGEQIFELQEKEYLLGQNMISAIVNDTLHRSVASGGLAEIDETHVALTDPEGAGAEVTFQYFFRIGVAGEHRLYYMGDDTPPPDTSSATMWFKVVGEYGA